ncbi:MAG: hypothetical protein EOP47_15815 [Sphingobacteriaceae bacterium]|nr:MAG: hypothetical protein EOP47_15815 [Sphingobacteriaceae bacterium]
MKQRIELRRMRDFGEIINDTFAFVKDNFKELFKPMIIICSFFIVLGTISYAFMQTSMLEGLTDTTTNPGTRPSFTARYTNMGYLLGSVLYYISFTIYTLFVFVITYSYIAIYKDKPEGEKPSFSEVWGYLKYYLLRSLGSSILIVLIITVGTVLCFFPGVYLGTVLSLVLPVIILENTSFGFAFNKSFNLIKNNWWLTFGIIFVISLIIGFASSIASIPVMLLTLSKMFLKWNIVIFPLMLIFGLLANILLMGYALLAISLSLCYFSYSEQKEGTGLLNRIDTLGKNDDASHLPTEQY